MRRAALAAAAAAALAYLPSLAGDFVNFEDYFLLLDNPPLRELSLRSLSWMAVSVSHATWQPLGWLLWALTWAAAGPTPFAFHLVNLVLHAACAALLALVAAELLSREGVPAASAARAAAAAAALWAVQPLHAESVAWATQGADLLATALGLGVVLAWLKGRTRWALALFVLSLLARWKCVTLPIVLLVVDRKRFDKRLAPFLALAAGAAVLNAVAKTRILPGRGFPLTVDVAGALLFYPFKLLRPFPSSVEYAVGDVLPAWAAWPVLALVVWGAWSWRRKRPAVWRALAAYALLAAPVLSGFSLDGRLAAHDHYAYLPLMPLFVLFAAGWAKAEREAKPAQRAAALAALAVALVLGAATSWIQCAAWRSSLALWERELEGGRAPVYARPNYAAALAMAGREEEAKAVLAEQARLFPR